MKLYKINESRLWWVIWALTIIVPYACVVVFLLKTFMPYIVTIAEKTNPMIVSVALTLVIFMIGALITWKIPMMPIRGSNAAIQGK